MAIVERLNANNHITIKISDLLPYKLKHLSFNRFTYHLLKEKNTYLPSILLYDENGYLLDVDLRKVIYNKFGNTKKEETIIRPFLC